MPDPALDRVEAMLVGFEHHPGALMVVAGAEGRICAANTAATRRLPGARAGLALSEVLDAAVGRRLLSAYDAAVESGEPRVVTDAQLGDHVDDWTWTPTRDEQGTVVGAVATTRESRAAVTPRPSPGDLVTALQDSLLPSELPLVPGLDIAARYVFAADVDHAGGDWFDALVCPSGCSMLVVGDVVGRGPAASVAMGQLRAVLHERLTSGVELHEALADLDRYAGLRRETFAATVCLVEVDPRTGALSYCTAGHPPPLVVRADGSVRYLPPTGGAPLATGGGFPVVRDQLAPGEVVVIYTDGVVARPGTTPRQGSDELASVVAAAVLDDSITVGPLARTAERVCQVGVEVLTQLGHTDDVTLLAAQRVPVVAPLDVELTTATGTTATARRALTAWLEGLAPRELDDIAIQHAVGELVINAVEHAYGPDRVDESGRPGAVRLSATLADDGRLEVTVSDHGRWRQHTVADLDDSSASMGDTVDLGERGRGIAMVQGFVDRLEVRTDDHGTRATVHHQLSRPAALLLPPSGPPGGRSPDLDDEYSVIEDDSLLCISGALHADVVDDLRLRLARASRGGSVEVRVDLSDVTFLGSAAVAAFHEAMQAHGDLILTAPSGSIAEQVLEVVRLPFVS